MRDLLIVYWTLIRSSWARTFEYRAQIVLWLISGLFPLVQLAVWLAVVDEVGPAVGLNRADFIAYYVAAAVVYYVTIPIVTWEWDEDIRTGNLSSKLLKPLDPFHYLVTNEMGQASFVMAIVLPVVALAALFVPQIRYPLTPALAIAFAVSLVAGFSLSMLMSSAFGMLGFWSTQARNVFSLWFGVGQFLSGWIAPLALFPENIRQIAYLLPFRTILGLPVEILTGRLAWDEIGFGFVVSVSWIIFFLLLYRILWRAGLRRYEAVGA